MKKILEEKAEKISINNKLIVKENELKFYLDEIKNLKTNLNIDEININENEFNNQSVDLNQNLVEVDAVDEKMNTKIGLNKFEDVMSFFWKCRTNHS